MFVLSSRTLRALTVAGALLTLNAVASAQFYDPCGPCGQPVAYAPPPVTVMANPCPCLQPVQETVYKEVPVTKYRTVQRTEKRPVIRTVYEDRPVTAYRTEYEQRTAEVPGVTYQTVTECRQVTQNRSYWRTAWQPNPKMSPCQYDPSPTFMGAMNRMGYSLRMAMTPNYTPRREFVPNVVAYNVPTTRTVAVPTTRQVTYNVAKTVPYQTTRRVAVQKTEYVEREVTAYEPYTEMETVAVGTTTRYALVDPTGGTATAARPTPAATAEEPVRRRTAEGDDGTESSSAEPDWKLNSYERQKSKAPAKPGYHDARRNSDNEAARVAKFTRANKPNAVRVAGWKTSRRTRNSTPAESGPALSVAAN